MSTIIERRWLSPTPALCAAALAIAALSGPVAAAAPLLTAVAALAALLAAAVMFHPPVAAYTFLCVSPLVVGMERGAVLPLLRPNEALIIVLSAALVARHLLRVVAGDTVRHRLHPVELAILAMAVTSSVTPLLWMAARGLPITQDDLLYASTIWKYYVLYLIFRSAVRTEQEVRRCLWLSVGIAAVLAVIGILQALQLFGVAEFLARWTGAELADFAGNRAGATIAHPQAFGDVMVFNMAICAAWLLPRRGTPTRVPLSPASRAALVAGGALFTLASIASGQFSEIIALVVAAVAVGFVTGRFRQVMISLLPVAVAAVLILQPVLDRRLSSVDRSSGLPQSWVVRWDNLNTYFLPELTSGTDFLFGVQLSARVPGPEWLRADWVYIESGHVWLLWVGGVPLFLAFFFFLWRAMGATAAVARRRADSIGVAAVASFASLAVLAVVTVFDPHLTLRGSADLGFPLLALALTQTTRDAPGGTSPAPRDRTPVPVDSPSSRGATTPSGMLEAV